MQSVNYKKNEITSCCSYTIQHVLHYKPRVFYVFPKIFCVVKRHHRVFHSMNDESWAINFRKHVFEQVSPILVHSCICFNPGGPLLSKVAFSVHLYHGRFHSFRPVVNIFYLYDKVKRRRILSLIFQKSFFDYSEVLTIVHSHIFISDVRISAPHHKFFHIFLELSC